MCVGVCKRMYGKAHVWRLDLPEGLVGPPLGLGSSTLFETVSLFCCSMLHLSARPVDLGASGDSLVSSSHLALGTPGLEICIIARAFT